MFKIEPEFIINMDETALNYNMPLNTTVHKVGAKTIFIKTLRQEKARVSVILSICGNGDKLPLILFLNVLKKGVFIKKNELAKKNKCYITCNCNAWSNKEIIKDWVNNAFINFRSCINV